MPQASARSAARRLLRPVVRAAVGFVVARPRLHGLAAGLAARVPVLRPGVLRAFGPPPAPAASPGAPPPHADPNEAYLFRPGPPPGDADGVVTVEALVHLSRAPPARR